MSTLAKLRGISIAPLVNASDIGNFQDYANSQIKFLDSNTSKLLTTRPKDCYSKSCGWIFTDGIYIVSNGSSIPTVQPIPDTLFPNAHFPNYQVAPIKTFIKAAMLDLHGNGDSRKSAIDQVLTTKESVFSDFLQLHIDSTLKPSAVFLGPITSEEPGEPIVAMFSGIFSFDEILRQTFLIGGSKHPIDCVVTSSTSSYTFSFKSDHIVIREGDFHDTEFTNYKKTVLLPSSPTFQLHLYPTKTFLYDYTSNNPIVVSGISVGLVVFISVIFLVYMLLSRRFEQKLFETMQLQSIASRDAQLKSKKVFIRYISHEVRLNFRSSNTI